MKKFVTFSLVAALSLTLVSSALASESKHETTSGISSSNAFVIKTFNWQKTLGWKEDLKKYDSKAVRFSWGSGSNAVSVTEDGYATSISIGETEIYSYDSRGKLTSRFEIKILPPI
ncbi:hypothetical protein [Paenibacillus tyrfis]|uniref:hypothetical protein n=1 Tax=Paenibacillus tyrfis TaxID=1501230 RepID=UPI000566F81C|nr:hypothetical protein [Paenibacillus tyrfis]